MFLKKGSKISLDKFIYKALYDKNKGYYMKGNPIGSKGDYINNILGNDCYLDNFILGEYRMPKKI